MRKFLKLIAVLFLLIFAVILCMFYGNPVSKLLASRNAEKYITENYSDTDFEIGKTDYNFKTGNYYVRVVSPSSADSSFTLFAGSNGKIGYDSYENAVINKWNTATRINNDYREAVEKVISSEDFPYFTDIGFGDIEFSSSDAPADAGVSDYAIDTRELVLDKIYDINELGARAGHLTIYVYDEAVNCDRLAEILLDIKKIMDEEAVSFYVIDCVLESPRAEDGLPLNDDRIEVMTFTYDDIYEEGLAERVRESDERAKAYYAALDAEKLSEEAIN